MNKKTETAIRSIEHICKEAIDHERGWAEFKKSIEKQIEIENEIMFGFSTLPRKESRVDANVKS